MSKVEKPRLYVTSGGVTYKIKRRLYFMKYADIHFPDVANGPGIRVSLFVSGCTHGCPECFNQEAWDFNYGKDFTENTVQEILQMCEDPADGLTLLGGEPLHPKNQQAVYALAKAYKAHFPHKTLWCRSRWSPYH